MTTRQNGPNWWAIFPFSRGMRMAVYLLIFLVPFLAKAQQVHIVKLPQLQHILETEKDKILVVNFWATWCAPCIKELPLIEKLGASRNDIAIKLVSMDMDLDPNPDKVRGFVARKKIASPVLILDERNPNSWIDKLDKNWSGALPATLIVNNQNGRRKFVEGELHEGDLEKFIEEVK